MATPTDFFFGLDFVIIFIAVLIVTCRGVPIRHFILFQYHGYNSRVAVFFNFAFTGTHLGAVTYFVF